jgi:hypothetical protein
MQHEGRLTAPGRPGPAPARSSRSPRSRGPSGPRRRVWCLLDQTRAILFTAALTPPLFLFNTQAKRRPIETAVLAAFASRRSNSGLSPVARAGVRHLRMDSLIRHIYAQQWVIIVFCAYFAHRGHRSTEAPRTGVGQTASRSLCCLNSFPFLCIWPVFQARSERCRLCIATPIASACALRYLHRTGPRGRCMDLPPRPPPSLQL